MKRKIFILCLSFSCLLAKDIPLYWWKPVAYPSNFGDDLSRIIVEKITGRPPAKSKITTHKLLAIGSILHFALNQDVIWGSGVNGKIARSSHHFTDLDVRAVRGPLTRKFLLSRGIKCPKIYGDPALLLPRLFKHLSPNPKKDYIVIPNLNEIQEYKHFANVVLPTLPTFEVIEKILEAKFVISGSLHGIIVAEAFNIPARLLRITTKEPLFKYQDYYLGTRREEFQYATSIEEALKMGGEKAPICDLDELENSFPYELFQN